MDDRRAAEGDAPYYVRSPVSVVRLLTAITLILVIEALAELLPSTSRSIEDDLAVRAGSWGDVLGQLADAVATAGAGLLVAVTIAATALARRPRQTAAALAAAGLTLGIVLLAFHESGVSAGEVTAEELQLALVGAAVATGAVTFTLFATRITQWVVMVIAVATVVGVVGSDISLAGRVLALLAGEAVGSAVALVVGVPSRRIRRAELEESLAAGQLSVTELRPLDADARGSQPWLATSVTGRPLFVKVAAVDELRADQLFRMWRRIRLRRAGDQTRFTSIRQAAEHEAFVAQRAETAGVRTPHVLGMGLIGADRGVYTVYEAIDGTTLDEVDDLGDAALRSAWSQIQVLHRAGIAHRDLRAANLMCHGDEIWVIDFGFSDAVATEELRQRDLAEFLASTTAIVGVERSVDAAVSVLGAEAVAEAIPWLQPLAVSTATRDAVSKAEFEELREALRAAAGISPPELPQLQRVTWKGVAVVGALGIAIWTLLPQLTSGVDWSATLEANPGWAAAALVASFATYLGAAVSMAGSVRDSVSLRSTLLAQLASSFTNRVTPAKVGGAALNLRFFVKQGIDRARAATGIAVSTLAGTVVHVVITVTVVVWAGNVGLPSVSLPSGTILVVVGGVLVVAVAAVAAVPPLRSWWSSKVVPSLRRSARSLAELVRSPTNLAMVFGGSALVTTANLVAFVVSLRAFDVDVPFATLGVVYLAGSALASAAPTPGGLGAAEAALVAGLAVVDVGRDEAIPAVLLFRLATFWIPILPGWVSLISLQRRGEL